MPGVGRFDLEVLEKHAYHWYAARPRVAGAPHACVLIYPARDTVDEAYASWIRLIVDKAVRTHQQMVTSARPRILALMDAYGLTRPASFSELVAELKLTHIKIEAKGAELIFASCSFFPIFDLNASLDGEGDIDDVWFDG